MGELTGVEKLKTNIDTQLTQKYCMHEKLGRGEGRRDYVRAEETTVLLSVTRDEGVLPGEG